MGCSEGTCSRRWVWNLDRLCKKCSVEGGGEFGTKCSRTTWRRGEKGSEDTDSKQAGWQILQILPCKTEQLNRALILRKGGVTGDLKWARTLKLATQSAPTKLEQREGINCLDAALLKADTALPRRGEAELEGTSLTKDTSFP